MILENRCIAFLHFPACKVQSAACSSPARIKVLVSEELHKIVRLYFIYSALDSRNDYTAQ